MNRSMLTRQLDQAKARLRVAETQDDAHRLSEWIDDLKAELARLDAIETEMANRLRERM